MNNEVPMKSETLKSTQSCKDSIPPSGFNVVDIDQVLTQGADFQQIKLRRKSIAVATPTGNKEKKCKASQKLMTGREIRTAI
jgi:hypothetical protein